MATSTVRIKLNPTFWRHSSCVPFSEDVSPSSLFLRNKHYLVVDIETQRTFQEVGAGSNGPSDEHFGKLGISVACAYDSKTDEFLSFRENELKKLFDLCEQRLVVGYNIRGFDLPVMESYGLRTRDLDIFDLMYDLEALTRQRYLKLEYVARGTLGAGKSADGLQAIEWWRQGKIDLIIEYCIQDVKITRDIFNYGRQNGFVKISRSEDSGKEVPVQWN